MYLRLIVPALVLGLVGCIPTGGTKTSCSSCEAPAETSTSCCDAEMAACCDDCCDSSSKKTQTIVELKTSDLDALQQAIAAHSGKVVVVPVWSVTSAPSREMMPMLSNLSNFDTKNVKCITVSLDPPTEANNVHTFLTTLGAVSDNYRLTDEEAAVKDRLQISSVPGILVFDRVGKLVARLSPDQLQQDMPFDATIETLVHSLLVMN